MDAFKSLKCGLLKLSIGSQMWAEVDVKASNAYSHRIQLSLILVGNMEAAKTNKMNYSFEINERKEINLAKDEDREYLLGRMRERAEYPVAVDDLERAISSIRDMLDDSWLRVSIFDSLSIDIGNGKKHGFNFFLHIVPLGMALDTLRNLVGLDRLIQKLQTHSIERVSAILEAVSAARYKEAGYIVELEPPTDDGHYCDFRVGDGDEWAYFECKIEYSTESKPFQTYMKKVDEIRDTISSEFTSRLSPSHRIDVVIKKSPGKREVEELIKAISQSIDVQDFNAWKECSGMIYAINSRSIKVDGYPTCVHSLQMKVGPEPKQVGETNSEIQIIYNPFNNQMLQKVRSIIKTARDQLPKASRGVILLETRYPDALIHVAEEKLREESYLHVCNIVLIGNTRWSIPNPHIPSFTLDFLNIAVSE